MGIITIKGMEFFAYHGCFSEEQLIGNHFIVDLEMNVDAKDAEQTDDLSQTVNYQTVYGLVKIEMEKTSKLIEHVAHRVLTVVQKTFPDIREIKITVFKLNPPLGGKVESVSYTMSSEK